MQVLSAILPFVPLIIVVVVVLLFLLLTIKVVPSNQALVITGVGATKKITETVPVEVTHEDGTSEIVEEERTFFEPKIKQAGAAFVIPFIQRSDKFDLSVQKTGQKSDVVKTKTGVEVMIDWVVAYSPNNASVETLQPAVRQFMGKDADEVESLISDLVAGGVRAVVSTMEPIEVMVGKEELDDAVQKNIAGHMAELGYSVQLYIQEVRDTQDSTYFHDVAAKDREDTRRNAANITADNDQSIRERKAETERAASEAELESRIKVAAKTRDTEVKESEYQAETDVAKADAEIAGELQRAKRQKELATNEGQIEVERQTQANLAAIKHQEVEVTNAETSRRKQEIDAEAKAAVAKKEAEGKAQASVAEANGDAQATKTRAEAEAAKTRTEGQAEADIIKARGEAEAEAHKAKGLAEAAAIKAKGLAQAEAERKLAEARAAEDRVNFEIQKLEIEKEMKISVATSVATAMASVGEKATFYDFAGSSGHGDGENLLTSVMGSIPQLFGKANLENQAINGEELTDTVQRLVNAAVEPLGVLNKETTVVVKDNDSVSPANSESLEPPETSEPPKLNPATPSPDGEGRDDYRLDEDDDDADFELNDDENDSLGYRRRYRRSHYSDPE